MELQAVPAPEDQQPPAPGPAVAAKEVATPASRPPAPVAAVDEEEGEEPAGQAALAKYSVYFDAAADEYLEATRIAGRKLKPRIAATRSAVVRLALTRLAEQMTADQAAAELARHAPERSGTGRPRF